MSQIPATMEQYAPFLSKYGLVLLPVIIGILTYWVYTIFIQSRQVSSSKDGNHNSSDAVLVSDKTILKSSDYDPRIQDEDNHVFQDKVDEFLNSDDSHPIHEDENTAQVPYQPTTYPVEEMITRSKAFYEEMNCRRTVRFFSEKPVPKPVIENIIMTAGTSPSGAHTEPWTFVAVSNREVKCQIRSIIEAEEQMNYQKRMGETWVGDLKKLRTNWEKAYLETAPYIIVVFKQVYGHWPDGSRKNHYYSEISASISVGLLLAAIQHAGLVTLTSTPMNAGPRLRKLLNRPIEEKVLLLLPIGYASEDVTVPNFRRKALKDIMLSVD